MSYTNKIYAVDTCELFAALEGDSDSPFDSDSDSDSDSGGLGGIEWIEQEIP